MELGGKSPCLVYTNNLDLAAKRIIWGKFFNAGQTCIAPDYVLLPKKDKLFFVEHCKKWVKTFYSESIMDSPDYGRIINSNHFDRLSNYLDSANILCGGEMNREDLYIEPTLIEGDMNSHVMNEEIFGPILPILCKEDLDSAVSMVRTLDKPLACYGFVDSKLDSDKIIRGISAGGMVINDTVVHFSNKNLPFGGVGESGMGGGYHGKFGFDLFSHKKAVALRSYKFENNLRYPPYAGKFNMVEKLFKLLG